MLPGYRATTKVDARHVVGAMQLESPTQGAHKAARRVAAYLAGTWAKKWWCPRGK